MMSFVARRRKPLVWLAVAGVISMSVPAVANPTGGTVVAGSATITTTPNTVQVNQSTSHAIINWQNFSIGSGETTRFNQPSSSSAVLNRVTSLNPSAIYGSLKSNGQVYLLNPNGILIGPGGQIKTAGFIASTLDVANAAFMSGGALNFYGGSAAGAINLGTIRTTSGDVLLLASHVQNAGTIKAPKGTVALGSGSQIIYVPGGERTLTIVAPPATLPNGAVVDNSGVIAAAAAELQAAGSPYAIAINNGGLISATTTHNDGGRVLLDGGQGATVMGGTILARGGALGGNGGNVEVSGGALTFTGRVDTSAPNGKAGTLLLDPATINIDAPTAAAIVAALGTTSSDNVVATNSIGVNAPITSSSSGQLTLDAPVIAINQPISLSNGQLNLTNSTLTVAGSSLSATAAITAHSMFLTGPFATTSLLNAVSTPTLTIDEASSGITSFSATNALNTIGTLDLFAHDDVFSGAVNVSSSSAMSVSGSPVAGSFTLSAGGNLTMESGTVLTAVGGNTTLASTGGVFANLEGADLLTGPGRKLIYSLNDGSGFNDGGLGYTRYNPVTFGNDPVGTGNVEYVAQSLTLPVTTIIGTASRTYGGTDSFSSTFAGAGGSDVTNLTFVDQSAATNVGTYTSAILPAGISSTRALSFVAGTLTINPAPLTVTAPNGSMIYGTLTLPSTAGLQFSGLVNGDTSAVVSGVQLGTTASVTSNVGSYQIVPFGGTASNYTLSYNPGTMTVTPAPLLFTVNPATGFLNFGNFGAAVSGGPSLTLPPFSASFTGFKNNDGPSAITGMIFTTNATSSSPPGAYTITAQYSTGAGYAGQPPIIGYPPNGGFAKAGNYFLIPATGEPTGLLTIKACASGSFCQAFSVPPVVTTTTVPGNLNLNVGIPSVTFPPLSPVVVATDPLGFGTSGSSGLAFFAVKEEQSVIQQVATAQGMSYDSLGETLAFGDPKNPGAQAQMEALVVAYLYQDLQNILAIDPSKRKPQQVAFVTAIENYIQAQKEAAAAEAVAQYQTWLKQQALQFQSLAVDPNGNPSLTGIYIQAAASTQPQVPPDTFLQQVQAGMVLTNNQINLASKITLDISQAAAGVSTGAALAGVADAPTIVSALPAMKAVFPNAGVAAAKVADTAAYMAKNSAQVGTTALEVADTAASAAEVVGTALGAAGAITECAAAVLTITLGSISYSNIGKYNDAFNSAVSAAAKPVSLLTMDPSTLLGYMTTMMATNGSVATFAPPNGTSN